MRWLVTRSLSTLALVLLLGGCSLATLWFEDGAPPEDDDDSSTDDDDDSSTDDDDDSSTDDDDDSSTQPLCPAPVPDHYTLDQTVWGDPSVHFYVPDVGWALATLHASLQLEGLGDQGIDLQLSPSWFFAVALEASYLGCSDDTSQDPQHPAASYSRRNETDALGCFALPESTVWAEICRMYLDDVDCSEGSYSSLIPSSDQAFSGRDNIEIGALTLAWYVTFAYAMSPEVGVDDPDEWFATAADVRAMEKLMALQHLDGPWSPTVSSVVSGCHNNGQLESCLTSDSPPWRRLRAVASHTEILERAVSEGFCYDRLLRDSDVEDYIDAIQPLWPGADWAAAALAAGAALDAVAQGSGSAPFQDAAPAVLEAIDLAAGIQLSCPGSELDNYYGYPCPP